MKTREKRVPASLITSPLLQGFICSILLSSPTLAQVEAGASSGNLAPPIEAVQPDDHDTNTHADPEPATATAGDPIFGTWVLNRGLSVYSGEAVQAPREQTRVYRPHPEGVEATVTTVTATGQETHADYIAGFDGVPHPVHGLTNSDSIKLERRNPYLSVATFLHAGMPSGTSERAITPDGRRLTITLVIDGEVISKSVYDRVE